MISVTMARRYARALLTLAEKRGELERTGGEMRELSAVFAREPRIRRYFESPNVSHKEKIAFLEERVRPKVGKATYGFLHVLLRRRRLDHMIVIADEYRKLSERSQGIARATVKTAVPITEEQATAITKAIARRTGLEILLTREVDPAVLGGAVVSLGHRVLDGTLARQLWQIRRQLLATRVRGRG